MSKDDGGPALLSVKDVQDMIALVTEDVRETRKIAPNSYGHGAEGAELTCLKRDALPLATEVARLRKAIATAECLYRNDELTRLGEHLRIETEKAR